MQDSLLSLPLTISVSLSGWSYLREYNSNHLMRKLLWQTKWHSGALSQIPRDFPLKGPRPACFDKGGLLALKYISGGKNNMVEG